MKCEKCKSRMKVTKSIDYNGDLRIRYYRCTGCGATRKTIEN